MKKLIFILIKNNYATIFCIALLCLFFLTCTHKAKIINIIVNTQNQDAKLFNNVKIHKAFILKSEDIVGNIQKVIYSEHNLYLFDKPTNKILCYNDDGEFIFRIHRVGKGPQEYTRIQNFYIDEKRGEVVIITGADELTMYSNKTGEFIRKDTVGVEGGMILDGCVSFPFLSASPKPGQV